MYRKLLAPFREFGRLGGLLYLIDRALAAVSQRCRLFVYAFVVQPVPDEALVRRRSSTSRAVRRLEPGAPELAAMPVPQAVVRARFAQDATCLALFGKSGMLAYMWFCHRHYLEDEVRCRYLLEPASESVFDYDFYVYPDYRLGRAFGTLWDGVNEELRARGVRQTFSRVSWFNVASRRAHAHLGGTTIGQAVFLVLGPVQLTAATVPPYLHLSVSSGTVLQLTLRRPPAAP